MSVRHGRPPLSAESLLSSANFTLFLLPVRLAHRIQALRNLPFIVVSNPHVSSIYRNYLHSLSILLPYTRQPISTLAEEGKFTDVLAELVRTHNNTIPTLARGFAESKKYISASEVTRFLDEHLRARIGTRLIAEQHIALHFGSQPNQTREEGLGSASRPNSYIGVIDTSLRPATIIKACASFVAEICDLRYGVRPWVVIDGHPDTTFAFIPVHLEYIVTELLKNTFRAVVEAGTDKEPVVITIAAAPADHQEDDGDDDDDDDNENNDNGHDDGSPSTCAITIRIRDRGGGIAPDHLAKIWSYSFTTFFDPELPGGSSSTISGGSGGGGSSISTNTTTSSSSSLLSNALTNIHHHPHPHHPHHILHDGLGLGTGAGGPTIAGLGYGLPLSRAYAEYFGGRITIQSMWGWGTDLYLNLKGLD